MRILRRTFAALLLLLLPGAPLPGSTDPSLLGSLIEADAPEPLRLALIESEVPADSAAPREVAERLAASLEIPVSVLHVPDMATSVATLQAGEVDLAVVEYGRELRRDPSLALTLPYHDVPHPDGPEQAFALAFRAQDIALCRRANELLIARALTGPAASDEELSEDLAGIRQRGRLRMITRHDPTTYFLHRGEELGFEFELMKRFAGEQNLELEIVVPPSP